MTTNNLTPDVWKEINREVWENRHKSQDEVEVYEAKKAWAQKKIRDYWEDLYFGVRFVNCMTKHFIRDLEHLSTYSAQELLVIPNMGKVTLKEVRRILKEHGMSLRGEEHLIPSLAAKPAPVNPTKPVELEPTEVFPLHVLMAAHILRELGWTVIPPSSVQPTV